MRLGFTISDEYQGHTDSLLWDYLRSRPGSLSPYTLPGEQKSQSKWRIEGELILLWMDIQVDFEMQHLEIGFVIARASRESEWAYEFPRRSKDCSSNPTMRSIFAIRPR